MTDKVKIRLRTEWLTLKECKELRQVLLATSDVESAELLPPAGVPLNRGIQASVSKMDLLIVVSGFAATKMFGKPLEDIGRGLSEELDCAEWGRKIARFLKSIPRRPDPYAPTVKVVSASDFKGSEVNRKKPL